MLWMIEQLKEYLDSFTMSNVGWLVLIASIDRLEAVKLGMSATATGFAFHLLFTVIEIMALLFTIHAPDLSRWAPTMAIFEAMPALQTSRFVRTSLWTFAARVSQSNTPGTWTQYRFRKVLLLPSREKGRKVGYTLQ